MRTFILAALIALYSMCAMAQGRHIGIEAGAGAAVFFHLLPVSRDGTSGGNVSGQSRATLFAGVSYLRNDSSHRRTYWGLNVSLQQYSFQYGYRSGGHSWGETIDQKSGFLRVAPKVEFGLGRSQTIHISLMMHVGFLLWANQTTTPYYGYPSPPPHSSTDNVSKIIWQPALAVSRHTRLGNNWDLVFAAGCSIMPGNLTTLNGDGVHPGNVYVTAGLARVYHRLPAIAKVKSPSDYRMEEIRQKQLDQVERILDKFNKKKPAK